jgi:hypothetical protein
MKLKLKLFYLVTVLILLALIGSLFLSVFFVIPLVLYIIFLEYTYMTIVKLIKISSKKGEFTYLNRYQELLYNLISN